MTPKISIITITFNSAKTVEETIKSVVSQGYPNLEYLIIDGASKDNTLEIVNKYKDQIAVISSEPDKGISDAFNKGIQKATGEIIGIINSDDILLPGALQAIADNYDPSVDVYRGKLILKDKARGLSIEGKQPDITEITPINYMKLNVSHPSTFITKRAYDKVGLYKVGVRYIMDIDILFRLYQAGCVFKAVPQFLAEFYLGGATSDSFTKKISERYKVLRDNGASHLVAAYVNIQCVTKDVVKLILDSFFGEDFKHKVKNRKMLKE